MIYPIEEISQLIKPIAEKYQISALYLYGSYARGEATESSDIDLVYQREGSLVHGLLKMSGFKIDLERVLKKNVDIVPLESFKAPIVRQRTPRYIENVRASMVPVYLIPRERR
ncbi:nucleotidyltransferase family protein [Secundilactobacillus muriivasis]